MLLAFLFAFAFPTFVRLANDFAGEYINEGVSVLSRDVGSMNMNPVLGYTGYFVLGYYLNKTAFSAKQRAVIYILGIVGFVSTIVLNAAASAKAHEPLTRYYGEFCVNVLLESVAVFTFFKYKKRSIEKLHPVVYKLSEYSFGAFLVHALVIEQLNDRFGLNTLSFDPLLSVISIGIIVFLVSFAVSLILNHIPVIKKYIV